MKGAVVCRLWSWAVNNGCGMRSMNWNRCCLLFYTLISHHCCLSNLSFHCDNIVIHSYILFCQHSAVYTIVCPSDTDQNSVRMATLVMHDASNALLLAIFRPSGCTVVSGIVVGVCNRCQMRTTNVHV